MTIGERLKMARHMAGLSQRDLAEKVGVSAMTISNYERGDNVPDSDMLIHLAKALDVKFEYFVRPTSVTLSIPTCRRPVSLPRKAEQTILAQVQEWLERYLDIEALLGIPPTGLTATSFSWPEQLNRYVASLGDVERVASELRRAWDLGLNPIENLMEVLEDHGVKVGLVEDYDDLDALTFLANEEIPVIVVKHELPGDRQRFTLARELGRLLLDPADDVDVEQAAHRFAGAFLVPESMARFELGDRRQTLDPYELHLLKHKYGLSMQGWIDRARDLNIISEWTAGQLVREFRQKDWHREEPGDQIPAEKPARLKRLVMRALAEEIISEPRAAELLGKPIHEFQREEAKVHAGFPVGVRV